MYRPSKLKYLGFGFCKNFQTQSWQSRPHESSIQKFSRTLKRLCKHLWSISMTDRINKLNFVIRGWINYFSIGSMELKMEKTDEHFRIMLRKVIWKQLNSSQKRAWGA